MSVNEAHTCYIEIPRSIRTYVGTEHSINPYPLPGPCKCLVVHGNMAFTNLEALEGLLQDNDTSQDLGSRLTPVWTSIKTLIDPQKAILTLSRLGRHHLVSKRLHLLEIPRCNITRSETFRARKFVGRILVDIHPDQTVFWEHIQKLSILQTRHEAVVVIQVLLAYGVAWFQR